MVTLIILCLNLSCAVFGLYLAVTLVILPRFENQNLDNELGLPLAFETAAAPPEPNRTEPVEAVDIMFDESDWAPEMTEGLPTNRLIDKEDVTSSPPPKKAIDETALAKVDQLASSGQLQNAYHATNDLTGHPSSTERALGWSIIIRCGITENRSRIVWALHGLCIELLLHTDDDSFTEIYFLALDTEEFCHDRKFPCPRLRQTLTESYPRLSAGHQPEAVARLKSGRTIETKAT